MPKSRSFVDITCCRFYLDIGDTSAPPPYPNLPDSPEKKSDGSDKESDDGLKKANTDSSKVEGSSRPPQPPPPTNDDDDFDALSARFNNLRKNI